MTAGANEAERDRLKRCLSETWSDVKSIAESDADYFLSDEFPGLSREIANKGIEELDLLALEYDKQLFPLEITKEDLQVFLIGAIMYSLIGSQECSSKRDRLESVFYVLFKEHRESFSRPQVDALKKFLRFEKQNQRSTLRDLEV